MWGHPLYLGAAILFCGSTALLQISDYMDIGLPFCFMAFCYGFLHLWPERYGTSRSSRFQKEFCFFGNTCTPPSFFACVSCMHVDSSSDDMIKQCGNNFCTRVQREEARRYKTRKNKVHVGFFEAASISCASNVKRCLERNGNKKNPNLTKIMIAVLLCWAITMRKTSIGKGKTMAILSLLLAATQSAQQTPNLFSSCNSLAYFVSQILLVPICPH